MKTIIVKDKKKLTDYTATIMAILVAVASAWMTIDWATFDITKEWPKLVLSAVIALGGIVSRVKTGGLVEESNGE